jgi:hypothetical protein
VISRQAVFAALLIYATEVYPTLLRGTGILLPCLSSRSSATYSTQPMGSRTL